MANNAGAIRAGRAFVELFTDANPMIRGLNQAAKKFQAWGSSLTSMGTKLALGGFGAGAGIVALVKSFADAGSEISDVSARTGIATETLSELKYAAEQSGASLGDLESGFRNLGKFLTHVREGNKEAAETLIELGLSMNQLKGKSPDQQLELIADRLLSITDPGIRASRAMEIFGKSGTMLLPLMSQGAKGIQSLRNEARELGLVMSKEDAAAADEMGDALDRLWSAVGAVKNAVGSAFAADLKNAATWLIEVAKGTGKWIRENRSMASLIVKVVAGVVAFGVGLAAVGIVMTAVGAGVKAMTATFGILAAAVAYWPLILATAAGAFLYFSGAGSQALNLLSQMFPKLTASLQGMYEGFTAVFGAIFDRLKSGDIAGAWEILTTTLEVGWYSAIDSIKSAWSTLSDYIIGAIEIPLRAITSELAAFTSELRQIAGVDIGADQFASLNETLHRRKQDRDRRSNKPGEIGPELADARSRLAKLLTKSSETGEPGPPRSSRDAGIGDLELSSSVGLKPASSFKSLGTFNSFAASRSFGAGDPAKQTAKNTADTAKGVKKVQEEIKKKQGLVFGA